jgi:acylphosphatase
MMKQLHAMVRGRVQMVGFRYFVLEEARRLGLTGWVRNRDDGATVEVVAEGDEDALQQLERSINAGPSGARVDAVNVSWADSAEGNDAFRMRH